MQSKIIKAICFYRDISVATLAKRLGMSPKNLYVKLTRDNFKESDLVSIADKLGCDLKISFIDRQTGKAFTGDLVDSREERNDD